MKKSYTKQIAAVATLALFSPWANAQVAVYPDGDSTGVAVTAGTGPLLVDGDAQVTGTLVVQPEITTSESSSDAPVGPGVDPVIVNNGTTSTVTTVLGTTEKTATSTTGGGATIENNGDATFTASTGTESSALFGRYTEVEINNADQPDPGQPVPGSQIYYASADGGLTAISPTFMFETDADAGGTLAIDSLEEWIAATSINDAAFASVLEVVPTTTSGGNVDVDGNLELGAIADVEAAIGDNTTAIGVNAGDIADNTTAIGVNAGDIADNTTAIGVNAGDIADNTTAIGVNAGDIADNTTAIGVNAGDIADNTTAIGVNAGDIADNTTAIGVNAGDIADNAGAIADNSDTLDVHFGLVSQNIADIADNTTAIADNAGDIADNAGDIADNAAATTDILTNGIPGIITKQDDGIHIGEDSLVTNEVDGVQQLWATDGDGKIGINIDGSDLNVNATFTVQGVATDPVTVVTPNSAPEPPYFLDDGVVANTVAVYTTTGDVVVTSTTFENSGVEATTDGNLTLYSSGEQTKQINYETAVRNDIYDETQGANAGLPVGDPVLVGGYVDADSGAFVELGVLVDGELDISALTEAQLEAITTFSDPIEGVGGNLQVGGDANVDGVLSVGGIADVEAAITENADTLDVHFGLVSQNITDIAANASDIADNADTLDVHFGLVSQNITDIATNATDIAGNTSAIQAEAATRAAADTQLQANIDAEAGARAAADAQLQANIEAEASARAAADANIVAGYQAADAAINSNVSALNNRIDHVSKQVEQNTRGIAMVAAMTSPTVREGMQNALDFHVSEFEGETGVATSYARRVNENVQLNIAAASTTDFEESVVRAGVSLQW